MAVLCVMGAVAGCSQSSLPDDAKSWASEPLGTQTPPLGEAKLDPSVRGKTVLVVGDSWAGNLAEGMSAVSGGKNRIIDAGLGGCGIMLPRTQMGHEPPAVCAEWPFKWPAYMKKYKPDAVLLRTGNWDIVSQTFEGIPFEVDVTNPIFRERYRMEMERAISILTANDTPLYLTNVRISEDEQYHVRTLAMNHTVRKVAKANENKGVRLLNLTKQMCNDHGCPVNLQGHYLFDESGHPAKWARDRLANWILNSMFAKEHGTESR